jgi:hypothetical protein
MVRVICRQRDQRHAMPQVPAGRGSVKLAADIGAR